MAGRKYRRDRNGRFAQGPGYRGGPVPKAVRSAGRGRDGAAIRGLKSGGSSFFRELARGRKPGRAASVAILNGTASAIAYTSNSRRLRVDDPGRAGTGKRPARRKMAAAGKRAQTRRAVVGGAAGAVAVGLAVHSTRGTRKKIRNGIPLRPSYTGKGVF